MAFAESGKTILLVEDEVATRAILMRLLNQLGHAVHCAEDGHDALEYLRSHPPPDVILLDLLMPGLSGWEFRRRQLHDPDLAGIPVVVLSAVGEVAAEADTLGDVGYLQKPVKLEQLQAAVDRFAVRRKPGLLVVEDDPDVLGVLEVGLRHYGFAVYRAGSGEEALTVYARHRHAIDGALLDVQMPGRLDGPETLKALRQANPRLRCCFLSGHTGRYSSEDLRRLDALVLSKPFGSFQELARVLWQLARPGRADDS